MKKLLLAIFFVFSIGAYGQNLESSPWHITAKNIDPNNYFGITVGNGMVGIVSSPEPMRVKDVVLNGVYDDYQRGRVSNILKTFNHVNFDLDVDKVRVNSSMISDYQQVLDMQKAVLTTTFDIQDKATVSHQVMSLRHLPFTALVILKITAKKDIEITPMNVIEAPDHLQEVRQLFAHIDRPHVNIPLMTSVAKSPSGEKVIAASSAFIFPEEHGHEPMVIHEDWDFNRHWMKFTKQLKAGESYEFALVASTLSSEHFNDPFNEAERLTIYARLEGTERLLKRHNDAWTDLWKGDIIIEGDLQAQKDVRSALYHLYSFARAGTAYSLSPMGLSGLGYNGHVFWDTELWMFPPLLMLHPEIAESLLEYRFERLQAAKQNAFAHGYKGAQFPWESADDGSEDTPVWALTGPFEHHISGDIAWAAWKYYQVTGDKEWLENRGWPIIKEVADFWVSRVERNGPGHFDINNVIGANEWEENIDNNAFTNAMAILSLQYATQAAGVLSKKADPEWNLVAKNIPILKFEDGTTKENATYSGVEIKQADVSLLTYPLQFYTDKNQIEKDLKYYEPRTSVNGPAMSFCVIATIYAKFGNTDKAYNVWANSFRPNAVPPFGVLSETAGGTNPYFATGAGGMLQTVLGGFAGLEITDNGIVQGKVNKPSHWTKLEVKGFFKRK
jgi:trehalose/maltose hydrolase-like predicted phosphorylase